MAHTPQQLTIETPEKILFTYKIGGIGLRIGAYVIDRFIQDSILIILSFIFGLVALTAKISEASEIFQNLNEITQYLAIAAGFLVYFILQWGYFLFFETLLNGQTIGKKICKLRVIRIDGTRLDFSSLFLRNFLRFADSLPLSDMLGGLMLIITKENRRLGDLAAGTVVVIDRKNNIQEPSFKTNLMTPSKDQSNKNNANKQINPILTSQLYIPSAKRLDEKNLYILRDILNNRGKLPAVSAISMGESIVKKLESRMDISSIRQLSNFEIIEEVYKAHHFVDVEQIITPANSNKQQEMENENDVSPKIETKSEVFVKKRIDRWHQTLDLMKKIRSRRAKNRLTSEDAQLFPKLYRQLCHDLAEARTLKLSPDILSYLNSITGQAHHLLYFPKPLNQPTVKKFFAHTLPRGVIRNYRYIIAAAILFWGTGIGLFFYVKGDSSRALKIAPSFALEQMDSMYQPDSAPKQIRTPAETIYMGAFYISNNVTIGFLSFATGVLLGIGSIFILLSNGVFLGTIFGYLATKPLYFENLVTFITAHSFLELTGIVLCGAAGIRLGVSLIESWRCHSNLGIEKHKEDILTLLFIGASMIILAAFVESGISPNPIPYPIKLAIFLASVLGFIGYFIIYPIAMEKRKNTRLDNNNDNDIHNSKKVGIIYG